jgi:hypothetical protein
LRALIALEPEASNDEIECPQGLYFS